MVEPNATELAIAFVHFILICFGGYGCISCCVVGAKSAQWCTGRRTKNGRLSSLLLLVVGLVGCFLSFSATIVYLVVLIVDASQDVSLLLPISGLVCSFLFCCYSCCCSLAVFTGHRAQDKLNTGFVPDCPYVQECRRFVVGPMQLPESYLNRMDVECFCDSCIESRRYDDGIPRYDLDGQIVDDEANLARDEEYRGWVRLGLSRAKKNLEQRMLDDPQPWLTAFHGTSTTNARNIIKGGLELLQPGDLTPELVRIQIHADHAQSTNGQDPVIDAFVKRIFASPSLLMCSFDIYARPTLIGDRIFKTVFELKCKSNTIRPYRHSLPWIKGVLDPLHPNDTLEWSTDARRAFEIISLFVKATNTTTDPSFGGRILKKDDTHAGSGQSGGTLLQSVVQADEMDDRHAQVLIRDGLIQGEEAS